MRDAVGVDLHELPPTCSVIDWPALIVLLPAETVIV